MGTLVNLFHVEACHLKSVPRGGRHWKFLELSLVTMRFCASAVLQVVASALLLSRGDCFYTPGSPNSLRHIETGASRVCHRWGPLADTPNKNLSAAEKERREEEKRLRERVNDVVIGKTSAVSGASDYVLDVASTQEKWMRQASRVEQEISRQTDLGMDMLRMLRLQEASVAFDRVFELKPEAYLWQAGIARYYLGDYDGAADIFARCAATYETRFGEPASEERIWRNACLLKKISSMSRPNRKVLEQTDDVDSLVARVYESHDTKELLQSERRKVLRLSMELFESTIDKDICTSIVTRAKLRSMGGSYNDSPQMDKKLWKISSLFYLGLHADALGDSEESKQYMKLALRLCPNANSANLVHTLPILHMTRRNWFDDDAFDSKTHVTKLAATIFGLEDSVPTGADPVAVESIRSSIEKMRLVDVRDALRNRGLKTTGSKEEAQGRLFSFLINDPDFLSWRI
jgi:tetratricopeptide (TPR) repeat protein